MTCENEITVTVNMTYEELIVFLIKKGFKEVSDFTLEDIYLVEGNCDLKGKTLDILKKCVLVRNRDNNYFSLVYKYKEYDDNENIISQRKSSVNIDNINDGINYMKAIGYKELIKVFDQVNEYEKDGLNIYIERVNNKYLFIEIEANKKNNTIKKLINVLDKTGIDYDKSNYFVKKAKIIFEEEYR